MWISTALRKVYLLIYVMQPFTILTLVITYFFLKAYVTNTTVFVQIFLSESVFDEYTCEKDDSFGVSLDCMPSIHGRAETDSLLEISAVGDGEKQWFTLKFLAHSWNVACYKIKLRQFHEYDAEIPDDLQHRAMATMSSVLYKSTVKWLTHFQSKLTIDIREEKISSDAQNGPAEVSVVKNDGEIYNGIPVFGNVQEALVGTYGCVPLRAFGKISSIANLVSIEMEASLPIFSLLHPTR